MSALPEQRLRVRAMATSDLAAVEEIERAIYDFPWTRGNFADSLAAGYLCDVMEHERALVGYGVLTVAAGESHLLNLSIAAAWQGRGHGRALLAHFVARARAAQATLLLLEVRPSNTVGRALYASAGFAQLAVRRDYYPAATGREDALLLGLSL